MNQTFRHALPVVLPMFIDRLGTSGINLLSAHLVQLQMSSTQSSLVLAMARSAAMIGPLLTGLVIDRVGNFRMAIVAFVLTGLSFLLLPSLQGWIGIMSFAFFAQFGMAMNKVCLRGLIFDNVPRAHHKEALGWVRGATNFGALVAYGSAAVLTLWWLPAVFILMRSQAS